MTSRTFDIVLNGFLFKTFTVMSLIKQIVRKMGSEDKGCREILLEEKIM